MPRLSTLGSAVMGIAGQTTSVNGTIPPALVGSDGGNWAWYSTTTIFGQADFGAGYSTYRLQLSPEVLTLVAAGEVAESSAGGSNWATWVTGAGVVTDTSLALVQGGLGEVSETGQFALVNMRATDLGLSVYSALGVLQSQTNAIVIPSHFIRLRGNVLSYEDAAGWHLRTGTTGAVLSFVGRAVPIVHLVPALNGSTVWVVEQDADDTLTLRGASQSQAFTVSTGVALFNPDARFIASNVIRIAYSLNGGESPEALVLHDINVATGAHTKATIVAGAPVFVAQPALSTAPIATSGGSSQAKRLLNGLYQQPLLRKGAGPALIDERWYKALLALSDAATAPIDLGSDQVTGVLDQTNGGTGNDEAAIVSDDLAPADAQYLVAAASAGLSAERVATDTASIAWDFATAGQAKADVASYWIPLVDGSEPPNFITDGAGHLVLVPYNP